MNRKEVESEILKEEKQIRGMHSFFYFWFIYILFLWEIRTPFNLEVMITYGGFVGGILAISSLLVYQDLKLANSQILKLRHRLNEI